LKKLFKNRSCYILTELNMERYSSQPLPAKTSDEVLKGFPHGSYISNVQRVNTREVNTRQSPLVTTGSMQFVNPLPATLINSSSATTVLPKAEAYSQDIRWTNQRGPRETAELKVESSNTDAPILNSAFPTTIKYTSGPPRTYKVEHNDTGSGWYKGSNRANKSRMMYNNVGRVTKRGTNLKSESDSKPQANVVAKGPRNILGTELQACCFNPMTGFFRDGYCKTNRMDSGTHVVCAIMTDEFLAFTKARGNDLSTPKPQYRFPGLKKGDGWCLCALRWKEAYVAGCAPPIKPEATHEKALEIISKEVLLSKSTHRSGL